MNKYIYIFLIYFAIYGSVAAQTRYVNDVKFENLFPKKINDELQIDLKVALETLKLNANDMLILTPILYSNTGTETIEFAPVVLMGKTRSKAIERSKHLNNPVEMPARPKTIVVSDKKGFRSIDYTATSIFAEWMRNASLKVRASVQGCAACSDDLGDIMISKRILREPYKPDYKTVYVVPEAEPVKVRSDRHSATFNFVVAKHELVRNYKGNASELDRVDKVILEVKNNKDINVTEFTISGYASPEGNYEYNRSLSERRANSFADYLSHTHGIDRSQFRVTGYGEDWEGLKEAIQKTSLTDKNRILHIIEEVINPDARDAQLKKLSHGETYRDLLENFYPPLRRTDYIIAYNVRPFNVEEAREIIKTNPKLLSLNEMYLVAQSYPFAGSEFKEVFDIAVRMYPSDPVAILNAAAVDIETKNYRSALDKLHKIDSDPRAWNNLGVAYALTGDTKKAKIYFEKGAANGDSTAEANNEELKKTMTD